MANEVETKVIDIIELSIVGALKKFGDKQINQTRRTVDWYDMRFKSSPRLRYTT